MGNRGNVLMDIKDINKIVTRYRDTEKYSYVLFGNDYYTSRNTAIMMRKKELFLPGAGITAENPFGSNHKIPSGHFKLIVDQKVQYLLGNGLKMDEAELEQLDNYFKSEDDHTGIGEMLIDLGTDASKEGEAWLYAYRENKKLKFKQIPTEQITPVYDDNGNLDRIIRDYTLNGVEVRLITDKEIESRYEKKKGSVRPLRNVP
jgi:SPP1 family phage portal protein